MNATDPNMAAGIMGVMMTFFWIFFAIGIFFTVCMWRIFSKAGKPGWACLIPIYSTIVFLDIVGKPWWWLILMCIPLVNFVILIIVLNELSKSFGKGSGFTVGLIFLSFIFIPILAFGSAQYTRPGGGASVGATATA